MADRFSYTFEDGVDGANDVAVDNNSVNTCLAVDSSTVHLMHVRASDDDLYSANDADTDTWTTPASTFTGTVNHISCNVIDRSGLKLAHIIDDGGTIKYDEDELAVVAPSGVIDQTLPSLTQSATADTDISGSISQSLPGLTQSATAAEIYTSTITQTLPSLTQSAIAAEVYTGTIAQTLPSLTQSLTAVEKFEGPITQTLPALNQAASATHIFTATISQTLPSLTQSATAFMPVSITGTITQTLPSLAQSATAVEVYTSTIGQTLPSLTQLAAANVGVDITGTIDQTLPSLSQSATATLEYPATIGQTLPSLTQSASATTTEDVTGAISQTLPALSQSATSNVVNLVTATSSGSWNPDWESYMPWAKRAARKAANDDNKEEIVKKAIRTIYHGEPPPGNAKQIIEAKDAEGHLVKGLIKDKKALNEVLSTYFVMERAEAERLRLSEEQARINQMQVNDDIAIVLMMAS